MRIKRGLILLALSLITVWGFAGEKKLRFAGTGGIVLHNDLLEQEPPGTAGTIGGGVAIAYPVSGKNRNINVEIGIANWYNLFPYKGYFVHTLRFGFGIRVFLNVFESVRPYFTHDICSHFVWVSDRNGYGSTFGILLGLGIDIPLKPKKKGECSSVFFDLSHNMFHIARFSESNEGAKFFSVSFGYSMLLPDKEKEE